MSLEPADAPGRGQGSEPADAPGLEPADAPGRVAGPADHSVYVPRLICAGNVVIDLVATVPMLPERGGDVIAHAEGLHPGGAFNVMVASARQGLPAAYAGAHGTGPFGDLARAAMATEGIRVLLQPTPESDTGYDIALTDAGGERTFVTVVGAEATLTDERLAAVSVGGRDSVVASGYGLLRDPNASAIAEWLGHIPDSACVLFDPGPLGHDIAPDILNAVLERADWFSCNEREALRLTGTKDAGTASEVLVARSPRCGIVVRLGARGCLLVLPGELPRLSQSFAVAAVDTNGAGDAHVGAFLAALSAGLSPDAAARRANAAAALSVTRRGPATAPTHAELDDFLARRPPLWSASAGR
ncbi:PfkB family carbohydrate kinase [Rathayibacter soli]|uniref:PfkB family carbohydrate kinase n=1 Tax=Rathayibacter soli TaxID=3144168 RepID=UPI0027E47DAD|nr:PfkB family carbohydrate kinase [Glaciibacter superstes]